MGGARTAKVLLVPTRQQSVLVGLGRRHFPRRGTSVFRQVLFGAVGAGKPGHHLSTRPTLVLLGPCDSAGVQVTGGWGLQGCIPQGLGLTWCQARGKLLSCHELSQSLCTDFAPTFGPKLFLLFWVVFLYLKDVSWGVTGEYSALAGGAGFSSVTGASLLNPSNH